VSRSEDETSFAARYHHRQYCAEQQRAEPGRNFQTKKSAARLSELARSADGFCITPTQEDRIFIEKVNWPFLTEFGGSQSSQSSQRSHAKFGAGLRYALRTMEDEDGRRDLTLLIRDVPGRVQVVLRIIPGVV
jgi:hypothetical protein